MHGGGRHGRPSSLFSFQVSDTIMNLRRLSFLIPRLLLGRCREMTYTPFLASLGVLIHTISHQPDAPCPHWRTIGSHSMVNPVHAPRLMRTKRRSTVESSRRWIVVTFRSSPYQSANYGLPTHHDLSLYCLFYSHSLGWLLNLLSSLSAYSPLHLCYHCIQCRYRMSTLLVFIFFLCRRLCNSHNFCARTWSQIMLIVINTFSLHRNARPWARDN